jgi:tripartite-type tricarboxylate transporter receptor subunit TctC
MPHMQTGKVKVLAVSTATRSLFFPDVATAEQQGIADFDYAGWVGLYGPAGLGKAVQEAWTIALQRAFNDPKLLERFSAMGIEPDLRDGAGLAAMARQEDAIWAKAAAAGTIPKPQ